MSLANAWIRIARACAFADAARAQVEQLLLGELAHRRAVRALHVVGEDLELRLGVDRRIVREQQHLVGLLRVGLLRVEPHEDLAVEHALAAIVEDALVELVALAVRLGVIDGRVVVHQPIAVDQVEPVHRAVDAFAVEHRVDVVAHQPAAERDVLGGEHRGARQVQMRAGDVIRREALALHAAVLDLRAVGADHFRHRVGEVALPRAAGVGLDDVRLAVPADDDERARMRGNRRRRCPIR